MFKDEIQWDQEKHKRVLKGINNFVKFIESIDHRHQLDFIADNELENELVGEALVYFGDILHDD